MNISSLLLRWTMGVCIICGLSAAARAEDWPQWRGPRGDGTSLEQNVPTHWSATENVRWRTPIPGKGHSSPVIWQDRIYVTTCLEDQDTRALLCVDRTSGKVLWQHEVLKSILEKKHKLNSFASATPATDGKHVWVSFFQMPHIELICYDMEGKEVWRKSPGEFHSVHGFCSSPILYKDMIILNCDQDAEACIVAYDRETGSERWRADRPNRTRSYSTPIIRDLAGKEQLMLSGSKCVASYDADTGKQYWQVDGPTDQFVASLVVTDGIVFCTGGFPEHHLIAITPDGSGNVSTSKVLWHDRQMRYVSYVPSPIAAGNWFFVVSDNGMASCWEARSGNKVWNEQLGRHHSASAVSAAGNLYFTADDGDTYVLKAGPAYCMVSKNSLGDECYASPAISHGEIYFRSLHNLCCISQTNP